MAHSDHWNPLNILGKLGQGSTGLGFQHIFWATPLNSFVNIFLLLVATCCCSKFARHWSSGALTSLQWRPSRVLYCLGCSCSFGQFKVGRVPSMAGGRHMRRAKYEVDVGAYRMLKCHPLHVQLPSISPLSLIGSRLYCLSVHKGALFFHYGLFFHWTDRIDSVQSLPLVCSCFWGRRCSSFHAWVEIVHTCSHNATETKMDVSFSFLISCNM